jgi:hypothetical protein
MPNIATLDVVAASEAVIRDIAGTVIMMTINRRDHPSYGYTKVAIRSDLARMDGAIGLYMVLTGQAFHGGVPNIATFTDPATTERVAAAREAVHVI